MIALQINTWNNQREESAKEKEYITLLNHELRTELEYLRNLKGQFEGMEISLKRLRNHWQGEDRTIKDSLQYIKDYAALGFISPWYTEPVTWTLLQQTGDLALIKDNDLKTELFLYHSTLKKTADNYLQFPIEMVKEARKEMDMAFVNDSNVMDFMNPLMVNPSHNISRKEVALRPEIFNQIWAYRKNILPLAVVLANISKAQQILMSAVIDKGERLLKNLEAFQREVAE